MSAVMVGYVISGLIATSIIAIGMRFILAPGAAADGYGLRAAPDQPSVRAYLNVKGVRDIASGMIVIILMVAGATQLLAWMLLAASIILIADTAIVIGSGGSRATALGVHGLTAAVMVGTAALLLFA